MRDPISLHPPSADGHGLTHDRIQPGTTALLVVHNHTSGDRTPIPDPSLAHDPVDGVCLHH